MNLNGYSIHLSTEITPISLTWSVPPVTFAKGLSAKSKTKNKTETDIALKHMCKHCVCPLRVKKGKAFHLHSKSFAVMSTQASQGKKEREKNFHLISKNFGVVCAGISIVMVIREMQPDMI